MLHSAAFLAVLSVHKSLFFHSFLSRITSQNSGKGIYYSKKRKITGRFHVFKKIEKKTYLKEG